MEGTLTEPAADITEEDITEMLALSEEEIQEVNLVLNKLI